MARLGPLGRLSGHALGLACLSWVLLSACKGKPTPAPVAVGSVSLPAPIASSLPIDPKIVSETVNANGDPPYSGPSGTVSGVSAGLAATDRRLVPYGALVATFHTGVGCLLGPSLLFFTTRALVGA